MSFSLLTQLQWLFPLAITIHNLEEAIWLPAWSESAGKYHKPVGKFEFRFAVFVLTVLAYFLTFKSISTGASSIYTYLFYAYNLSMWINVFLPHVAATILLKRYCPGLLTALLLNLPVTSLLLYNAIKMEQVSLGKFIIISVVFTGAILVSIPLLFRLGQKIEKYLI